MTTVSYADNWEDVLLARLFAPGHRGFSVGIGESVDVTRLFSERGWSGINVGPERTLAELCDAEVHEDIDFLVIGVPGQEREILDGGDWQRWRPHVVLVRVDRHGPADGHEAWEKVLLDAGYRFGAFNGSTRFYVRSEDGDLLPMLATPVNVFDDFVAVDVADEQARLRGELAASRAVNQALRSLYAGVEEIDALRAQTSSLEAAAAAISAQCEENRALMADALSRYEQLRRDVLQTRIEVEAAQSVFRSVGPAGMAVAQRLARASLRFPAAGAAAKRSARLATWLKGALRSGR